MRYEYKCATNRHTVSHASHQEDVERRNVRLRKDTIEGETRECLTQIR